MDLSFLNTPRENVNESKTPAGNKGSLQLVLPDTPRSVDGATKTSGEDDSTMATPRSSKTQDEFDDPDINDMLDDTKDGGNQVLGAIGKFVNKQAKAFVRNFVDYGPPYTRKPFDATLVMECSKPVMNHIELHRQLNKRLDPNIPDPEDLYYYPIHWCARNIHFAAMKMLRRAGAKVNVTNELGCSPLDMCVMMKLPPDKRKDQLKMVKYLLANGADPNNRDKGGFSAIDQAAINQDLEIIQMLLAHGANVLRENYTLVAKRHHILRHVYEPEVYRVLYEQLLLEQGEYDRKQMIREKMLSEVAAERHHVKLFHALDKRKQKRLDREAARDDSAKHEVIMSQRMQHLQAEMEANLKNKEKAVQFQGTWTKDDVDHWSFRVKSTADRINSSVLYADNLKTMKILEENNHRDKYSERWQKATEQTGSLELLWTKADPFILPPITDAVIDISTTLNGARMRNLLGSGSPSNRNNNLSTSRSRSKNSKAAEKSAISDSNSSSKNNSEHLQLTNPHHHHSEKHTKMSNTGAAKGGILKSGGGLSETSSLHSKSDGPSHSSTSNSATRFSASVKNNNHDKTGSMPPPQPLLTSRSYVPTMSAGSAEYSAYDASGALRPIVSVQYADENDRELYDEDLEEMLRELTTF